MQKEIKGLGSSSSCCRKHPSLDYTSVLNYNSPVTLFDGSSFFATYPPTSRGLPSLLPVPSDTIEETTIFSSEEWAVGRGQVGRTGWFNKTSVSVFLQTKPSHRNKGLFALQDWVRIDLVQEDMVLVCGLCVQGAERLKHDTAQSKADGSCRLTCWSAFACSNLPRQYRWALGLACTKRWCKRDLVLFIFLFLFFFS